MNKLLLVKWALVCGGFRVRLMGERITRVYKRSISVLALALCARLSVVYTGVHGEAEMGEVARRMLGADKVKRYGDGLAAYQRKV